MPESSSHANSVKPEQVPEYKAAAKLVGPPITVFVLMVIDPAEGATKENQTSPPK
jgi:hypothetical protein